MTKREPGVFPSTPGVAPYTSGIMDDFGMFMPPPQENTTYVLANGRGKIIPANIGNTDYIDANTTWHAVLVGDY